MHRQDRIEVFLTEYKQAAVQCKQHEDLVRQSVTIYFAFYGAVAVAVFGSETPATARIVLALLLGLSGMAFANTIYRSKKYYACYVKRAKEIEHAFDMALFRKGADVEKELCPDISNKSTFLYVILALSVIAFLYAVFLISISLYTQST